MTQEKAHRNCKYFSYRKCPHITDEIMKLATQDITQITTGVATLLNFPTDEEVDKICSECDSFVQK